MAQTLQNPVETATQNAKTERNAIEMGIQIAKTSRNLMETTAQRPTHCETQ